MHWTACSPDFVALIDGQQLDFEEDVTYSVLSMVVIEINTSVTGDSFDIEWSVQTLDTVILAMGDE